jgi:hypothetical protein
VGTTSCSTGVSVCVNSGNKPIGTLCGATQSCTGGVRTSDATCNALAQCVTTMMTCASACNAAGTDCNACLAGETMCTNGCQNLSNDPDNCMTCGHVCAQPPVAGSGSATCGSSNCGFICNAGYLKCSGTTYCQIASWDFEGTTTDGFGNLSNGPSAVTGIAVNTARHHGGAQALAIGIDAKNGSAERNFDVGVTLCGGSGSVPANAQTVTAWVFLEPASDTVPDPDPNSQIRVHLTTGTGEGGTSNPIVVGQWFQISTSISSIGSQLLQLGVQGGFGPGPDWSGTIYVDDISIQ